MNRMEFLTTTAPFCRRAAEDVLKAVPNGELADRMLDIAARRENDARELTNRINQRGTS
jgi:hypothetical protein